MDKSPVKGKYDTAIDAESAYEMLQKRVAGTAAPADGTPAAEAVAEFSGRSARSSGRFSAPTSRAARLSTGQVDRAKRHALGHQQGGRRGRCQLGKSVGGSMGGSVGRALVRGALGGLLRR